MTDSNTVEHPPCEGRHRWFSIRCRRCGIWRDCWFVKAFNEYMDEDMMRKGLR